MNNFDLVFFHDKQGILNLFTPTSWNHVGMILKNPTWLHPSLQGTYIWEVIDSQLKLTPLSDRLDFYKGRVYVRKTTNKVKMNDLEMLKINDSLTLALTKTLSSYLGIKEAKPCNWSIAFIIYVFVRTKLLNYHGIQIEDINIVDFTPHKKIDNFILPGLAYSSKLTKLR